MHALILTPADTRNTSFPDGFALPAKRGKTNDQLAPSEPEGKEGVGGSVYGKVCVILEIEPART